MDKFEQHQQKWMKRSDAERKAMTEQNKKLCICGGCPSYEGTGEKALLFCMTSKSAIIKRDKGCICTDCPVAAQSGLTHLTFCLRGTEAQQRGKTK
jgi:hypothetical protein